MAKKKGTKKLHPVKSRKAGPSPSQKGGVFNRVKKKKKVSRPAKTRRIKVKVKRKAKAKVKRKVKRKIKARKRAKVFKPAKLRQGKASVSDNMVQRTKIRIIGIGGGGGSIVSEIASRIKKADFVAANTDARALKAVKKAKRFQFGQSLTRGLGTGMNTELGEMAAQAEKEKIKKLFEGQDLCIIVDCLGGGTGSGAAPIFAKISKSLPCLTYGIFTLPFEFEGEKKMEIAKEALAKIKTHLNAYSVIPNERIFQIIDKDTPLKDALSAINKRLAENLEGLIGMIYLPGLINIDFADLKTILAGRGRLAYLNTVEIEEPDKEGAAKKVISSPLYPYTIKGARGILYNVVGGKMLQLSEVSQISKIISDSVNKNAKIIFGINQSQKYQNKPPTTFQKKVVGGKIKITLLATGCGAKGVLLKPLSAKIKKKPKKRKKPRLLKRKPKPKIKLEAKPKLKELPVLTKPSKVETGIVPGKKALIKKKPKPLEVPIKKKEAPSVKPQKKPKPSISPLPSTKKKLGAGPTLEKGKTEKVRRNALQLKKVLEEEEKELLEKEKIWETPAILRRKNHGN